MVPQVRQELQVQLVQVLQAHRVLQVQLDLTELLDLLVLQ
jgi:hypothetical protein